ncbi:hypothetical protein N9222_01500, partial [Pseudomonadales bacterium]|nr:hypothetical protein [Pseudomonadales bacterium]
MNLLSAIQLSALFLICMTISNISNAQNLTDPNSAYTGVKIVDYFGYDDCIELKNANTRVVLCPAAGGRVLEYS